MYNPDPITRALLTAMTLTNVTVSIAWILLRMGFFYCVLVYCRCAEWFWSTLARSLCWWYGIDYKLARAVADEKVRARRRSPQGYPKR